MDTPCLSQQLAGLVSTRARIRVATQKLVFTKLATPCSPCRFSHRHVLCAVHFKALVRCAPDDHRRVPHSWRVVARHDSLLRAYRKPVRRKLARRLVGRAGEWGSFDCLHIDACVTADKDVAPYELLSLRHVLCCGYHLAHRPASDHWLPTLDTGHVGVLRHR